MGKEKVVSADIQRELEHLRKLTQEHGRYLRQYFSFTLKEMSAKIGISDPMFLMIIHGQKKMPVKYLQRFIEVFKEMRIEERTKDFKPTEGQLLNRSLREKIRLHKMEILFYIATMVMCREYILC